MLRLSWEAACCTGFWTGTAAAVQVWKLSPQAPGAVQVLGQGGFGTVYKALKGGVAEVAVKVGLQGCSGAQHAPCLGRLQ